MSKKTKSKDVAEYIDKLAAFVGRLDCTDKDVPRAAGRLATAAAVVRRHGWVFDMCEARSAEARAEKKAFKKAAGVETDSLLANLAVGVTSRSKSAKSKNRRGG